MKTIKKHFLMQSARLSMHILIIPALMLGTACSGSNSKNASSSEKSAQSPHYKTIGSIEKRDDKLTSLIPQDAQIEVLAEGFTWSEGPVWVEDEKYLLFSDPPEDVIYKWKEGEGKSVYLEPSGYTGRDEYSREQGSNGLAINAAGKLLLCQHGDRRVAVMNTPVNNSAPDFSTIAGTYQGKKLNSPNDLAIYKDGSIYFTDPPYGLPGRENSDQQELGFYGVFKVGPDGKNIILLEDALTRPNGIAFSPDYGTCYVNVSDPGNRVTMAYDINAQDGTFENGRVFFDHNPVDRRGLPDGLKVHPSGYVFTTGPGGVLVLSPRGEHIGTIITTKATANCAFDSNHEYLYITADDLLLRVRLVNEKHTAR